MDCDERLPKNKMTYFDKVVCLKNISMLIVMFVKVKPC